MFSTSQFDACLKAGLAHTDHSKRSLSWNLLHDWRVTKGRFADFVCDYDRAAGMSEGDAFWNSFASSHYNRVQNPLQNIATSQTCPAFLDEGRNAPNIYGVPTGLSPLADCVRLVTVTPLTKLWRTFETASCVIPEFADYRDPLPGGAKPSIIQWLDKKLGHLQSRPRDEHWTDLFLKRLLSFIGANLTTLPYEPTWVALWEEFEPRAYTNSSRWQAAVGVPPSSSDEWLLLQVYPKSLAPTLVRPSQLDAGVWAAHFPQPPSTPHGRAMDLQPPDDHRLTEYIHARADMRPWLDDPNKTPIRACVRVPGTSEEGLAKSQRAHLQALANQHGPLDKWIMLPHPAIVAHT